MNVLWDAKPAVGDRIVVIGAGVVGLLVAWLCAKTPSASVTVVDINPARAEIAQVLGLSMLTEAPRDANADLVIHASGQAGRPGKRAGHRRLGGNHRRGKLVRESTGDPFSR